MGQTLNCFASSLTLDGDLSDFPEKFKNETYHRTEDPLPDRTKNNDGYKATFYSNKDEDKHILVHDHLISFEQGGTYREALLQHVYNKTMKVEGNKLVVVDAPVKTIIIYDENEPKNCGTYTKDKFDKTLQRYIYIGPIRNAYFNNNLVVIGDKTKQVDYGFLPLGTIKNDTMTIGTKPVEDANTGWRSSNGGIKF